MRRRPCSCWTRGWWTAAGYLFRRPVHPRTLSGWPTGKRSRVLRPTIDVAIALRSSPTGARRRIPTGGPDSCPRGARPTCAVQDGRLGASRMFRPSRVGTGAPPHLALSRSPVESISRGTRSWRSVARDFTAAVRRGRRPMDRLADQLLSRWGMATRCTAPADPAGAIDSAESVRCSSAFTPGSAPSVDGTFGRRRRSPRPVRDLRLYRLLPRSPRLGPAAPCARLRARWLRVACLADGRWWKRGSGRAYPTPSELPGPRRHRPPRSHRARPAAGHPSG